MLSLHFASNRRIRNTRAHSEQVFTLEIAGWVVRFDGS